MSILVAYATRHGATRGIAERIAERLRADGLDAVAKPAAEVHDATGYDAFIVGGAAYMFRWLGDATKFVKRNRALLAERPTWLFSSGPVGPDKVDKEGRDVLVVSVPKEFAELRDAIHPREEKVFYGALDPEAKPIGFAERLVSVMPAAKASMPKGDFRDWPAIDAWADDIAHELAGGSARVLSGAIRGPDLRVTARLVPNDRDVSGLRTRTEAAVVRTSPVRRPRVVVSGYDGAAPIGASGREEGQRS